MARLVAVCREGEEDYQFLARQIPLFINDTLTVSSFYVFQGPRGVVCVNCGFLPHGQFVS